MVDSTSLITYHHLASWLQGNLVLVDLMFNFDDPNNDFESQLDTMLQNFENGLFKEYIGFNFTYITLNILFRWTRFLVVITSHSDPNTGDLHIAPNNTGSVPIDEVSFFSSFWDHELSKLVLNSIPAIRSYFSRTLLQHIAKG